MKNMRKLASLLLALVMVLSLATTAFAADGETTGTITLDNPISGQTYTAYKIFDVVYSDGADENTDPDNFAYTIKNTSPWFETVKTFASMSTGEDATDENKDGLTLTASSADPTVYIVETTDAFSAPAFAAALKKALKPEGEGGTGVNDTNAQSLTVSNGSASVTNLDLGYWFVTSTTGALCNLTTTTPTATIHDKNDVPFEKAVSDNNPEVGQTLTFTLTGKVPDTTGFETYTYEITDTMSEGLTFSGTSSVSITVGGESLMDPTEEGADTYFTLTDYANGDDENTSNGFKLSINVKNLQDKVTKEIKVTYTATVNEKAIAKIDKNTAKLEYSNNPADETKTSELTEEEKLYTAQIAIDKYAKGESEEHSHEGENADTHLANAKFVLYKTVADSTEGAEQGATKKQYYKYTEPVVAGEGTDAVAAKVEWVDDIGNATVVTTNENGAANFGGLENGTYYLHETAAPAGYNLLKEDVSVTISGSDSNENSLTVISNVANNTGAELPETGGMGTTLFYVFGGILVLAAVVLLVTKKRMATK